MLQLSRYYYLSIHAEEGVEDNLPKEEYYTLLEVLKGDYAKAAAIIGKSKKRSNDKYGCQLIVDLLTNEKLWQRTEQ